jgi:pyridoxine 4-dehydrogenase
MATNDSTTRRTPSEHPAGAAGTIHIGDQLEVNRMGYGAMRITGRGIMGAPADRAEAVRVLRRAVDLGVEFIDTADSYGPYVSEEIIAEALHPYPADVVIATKGGLERPGPDQWTSNGRPEHLRRALDGSLKRLKVDRIDLWQLHRIDPEVPEAEQFGALAEFVQQGKVRFVGLSEVDVEAIERAQRHVRIVSVQNRYNVIDRVWDPVVDYCDRHCIAFIPWFPLAAGSIDRDNEHRRMQERIERVARRHDATPMQVALAWLLERSPQMLVIPGTSKVRHLEENIAAAELELDNGDLEVLSGHGH